MFQNYRIFLSSGKYSELLCHALDKKDNKLAYNTLYYYHLSDDDYKVLNWSEIMVHAGFVNNQSLIECAVENGGSMIYALFGYAKGGHIEKFNETLSKNLDINLEKLLRYSLYSGNLELVKYCISLGAYISDETYFYAAEARQPEVLKLLWKIKKENLNSAIEIGARDTKTFETLLELLENEEQDISWKDALITAYEADNKEVIEILEIFLEEDRKNFNFCKLVAASAKGDIETVKSLIDYRYYDSEDLTSTVVEESAINGWYEIVQFLLEKFGETFLEDAVRGACLGGYRIILQNLEKIYGRDKVFSLISEDVLKESLKNIKVYVRGTTNIYNREFVKINSSERERVEKVIQMQVERYMVPKHIPKLQPTVKYNYPYTISITFGDVAENHVGMEKLGVKSEHGYSFQDLQKAQYYFTHKGCQADIYSLHSGDLPEAYILIIRNAVTAMGYDPNSIATSLRSLTWDDKYYDTRRGKVLNKIARHNLCFRNGDQVANFAEGKGTVIGWERLPELNGIRQTLESLMDEKELQAEGNLYYDVSKCGIGWHGDAERRKVIAIRFGQTMKLCYRWYQRSQMISDRMCFDINNGDMYIMSEKAVGTDWMKKVIPTLRHSAGCEKYIK